MSIFIELSRREASGRQVNVAVVGTGYFGGGLVKQISRMRGLRTVVAANRTLDRAVAALLAAGAERTSVRVCDDPVAAAAAIEQGLAVATSDLRLPAHLAAVDVVMEATGDVLVGTEIALEAIQQRKHIVAANSETQATVGPLLKRLADEAGVIYSDIDGDQPGILKNLYDYCEGLGFTPVVAGNCKGVMKRYATPATQAAFAEANAIKPWIATAAADGTKLNIEMAIVANATGMLPAVRGMTGLQTDLGAVLDNLDHSGLLSRGPIVEYTLGIPSGVFLVARSGDPGVIEDFRYLKMGDGPHYLFYRPYVLTHYEAPLSAAEAVLSHAATITPLGAPLTEVATYAKRDLKAGTRLDGIGGFDCYGLIVEAAEARTAGCLPIGIAAFARLTRDVAQDEPIDFGAVVIEEENLVLDLRRQQDQIFSPS